MFRLYFLPELSGKQLKGKTEKTQLKNCFLTLAHFHRKSLSIPTAILFHELEKFETR